MQINIFGKIIHSFAAFIFLGYTSFLYIVPLANATDITPSPTETVSITPIIQPSNTPSPINTPALTETITPTTTVTISPTGTPTTNPTVTPSPSISASPTPSDSITPTPSATQSAILTSPTPTPTATSSANLSTPTPSPSVTVANMVVATNSADFKAQFQSQTFQQVSFPDGTKKDITYNSQFPEGSIKGTVLNIIPGHYETVTTPGTSGQFCTAGYNSYEVVVPAHYEQHTTPGHYEQQWVNGSCTMQEVSPGHYELQQTSGGYYEQICTPYTVNPGFGVPSYTQNTCQYIYHEPIYTQVWIPPQYQQVCTPGHFEQVYIPTSYEYVSIPAQYDNVYHAPVCTGYGTPPITITYWIPDKTEEMIGDVSLNNYASLIPNTHVWLTQGDSINATIFFNNVGTQPWQQNVVVLGKTDTPITTNSLITSPSTIVNGTYIPDNSSGQFNHSISAVESQKVGDYEACIAPKKTNDTAAFSDENSNRCFSIRILPKTMISPTLTPTPTNTPSPTLTPSPTIPLTNTPTPTVGPTITPTPSFEQSPTPTVIVSPTNSPSPTMTPTGSIVPTNTPIPTVTPINTTTPTHTSTPSPTQSQQQINNGNSQPTITITPLPTSTIVPTSVPNPTPTQSIQPTVAPTSAPQPTSNQNNQSSGNTTSPPSNNSQGNIPVVSHNSINDISYARIPPVVPGVIAGASDLSIVNALDQALIRVNKADPNDVNATLTQFLNKSGNSLDKLRGLVNNLTGHTYEEIIANKYGYDLSIDKNGNTPKVDAIFSEDTTISINASNGKQYVQIKNVSKYTADQALALLDSGTDFVQRKYKPEDIYILHINKDALSEEDINILKNSIYKKQIIFDDSLDNSTLRSAVLKELESRISFLESEGKLQNPTALRGLIADLKASNSISQDTLKTVYKSDINLLNLSKLEQAAIAPEVKALSWIEKTFPSVTPILAKIGEAISPFAPILKVAGKVLGVVGAIGAVAGLATGIPAAIAMWNTGTLFTTRQGWGTALGIASDALFLGGLAVAGIGLVVSAPALVTAGTVIGIASIPIGIASLGVTYWPQISSATYNFGTGFVSGATSVFTGISNIVSSMSNFVSNTYSTHIQPAFNAATQYVSSAWHTVSSSASSTWNSFSSQVASGYRSVTNTISNWFKW